MRGLAPELPRSETDRPAQARKRDWISAAVEAGVLPGAVVGSADDRSAETAVVAFALFGPTERFAPRSGATPRTSRDALQLATLWVADAQREAGLGRLLLQAALREAVRRDLAALEVYGDRRFQERTCTLPATWLLHQGFTVHREHPRTPLFRLETRRVLRWAESLEHALDEVLAHLPTRMPEPGRVPTSPG